MNLYEARFLRVGEKVTWHEPSGDVEAEFRCLHRDVRPSATILFRYTCGAVGQYTIPLDQLSAIPKESSQPPIERMSSHDIDLKQG